MGVRTCNWAACTLNVAPPHAREALAAYAGPCCFDGGHKDRRNDHNGMVAEPSFPERRSWE
eukprot:1686513-Alexandrium_andersonii.AAC.1